MISRLTHSPLNDTILSGQSIPPTPSNQVPSKPRKTRFMQTPPEYARCFMHSNYAFMRHIRVEADEVTFVDDSEHICKEVIAQLAGVFKKRRITIIHSPILRAVNTANLVAEELRRHRCNVGDIEAVEWLDEHSREFGNSNIGNVCRKYPKTFILFIGHLPQIRQYLGGKVEPVYNTVISRDFLISGKRAE